MISIKIMFFKPFYIIEETQWPLRIGVWGQMVLIQCTKGTYAQYVHMLSVQKNIKLISPHIILENALGDKVQT